MEHTYEYDLLWNLQYEKNANGADSVMQSYTYPSEPADIVKLHYHLDRLGSADYLTDNIVGKVASH
ncbi:MAG: hypothetical protein FWH55_09995 [Oscillospiraceae bacterium]|nr:hypothetical protein [Oscillospiraceae bacterium]